MEERYLEIVAAVDAEFSRNRRLHGDKIHCASGCTECCYHLFQITEPEAAYIASGVEHLDKHRREALRERARGYLQALEKIAPTRLSCPALEDGVCSIYEFRPLMCHKFGMPLYNPDKPGQIFACELNFQAGEEITDPQLIQIQTRIHQDWKQLQAEYRGARGGHSVTLSVAQAILQEWQD